MSSYILVHRKDVDKRWWSDLVRACAVVEDTFEIHCWSDDTAELMAAFQYGHKVKSSWSGGTLIREKQSAVDRILDQMSDIGTVHRNIG